MSTGHQRKIDLNELNPEQLVELRKSTEEQVNHFTQSLQALQTAQSKLKECVTSVDNMEKTNSKDILVPMTSSLYIPGQIVQKDEYLVDIGTGYFVGKSASEAKEVYRKKVEKLDDDGNKLKEIMVQKNEILNSINLVLRSKMIEYEKQQENNKS